MLTWLILVVLIDVAMIYLNVKWFKNEKNKVWKFFWGFFATSWFVFIAYDLAELITFIGGK